MNYGLDYGLYYGLTFGTDFLTNAHLGLPMLISVCEAVTTG